MPHYATPRRLVAPPVPVATHQYPSCTFLLEPFLPQAHRESHVQGVVGESFDEWNEVGRASSDSGSSKLTPTKLNGTTSFSKVITSWEWIFLFTDVKRPGRLSNVVVAKPLNLCLLARMASSIQTCWPNLINSTLGKFLPRCESKMASIFLFLVIFSMIAKISAIHPYYSTSGK